MQQCSLILLISLFLFAGKAVGQNCSDGDRYLNPIGTEVESIRVDYATTRGYFNESRTLRADVFTLKDDTTSNRPLIVLAHGGAFIFGSRNDLRNECIEYAKRGYVCASIDYRLYPILLGLPDSARVVEIAFNAISDMKAAVRYFRSEIDRENPFRIDPVKIYAGGVSAGAILALHTGLLDVNDPLTEEFVQFLSARGGVEGNTGDSINMSYSSSVAGVINFSGALFDLSWIDNDDPFVMSMHGDNDATVPYGSAREGAFNRVTVHGSASIHERMDDIGLSGYFVGVPGGGHTDIYTNAAFSSYFDEFKENSLVMLRQSVCATTSVSNSSLSQDFSIFPNPARQSTMLQFEQGFSGKVQLLDLHGKLVINQDVTSSFTLELNLHGLHPGTYFIRIIDVDGRTGAQKLLVK
jgi:para-nitrobenzyl esterase